MIVLTDLAHKLEEILNNSNIASVFQFVVKSQGYHLDSIADQKTGKNTIPVFVGIAGGEYNAVPNLKQVNFNYSVSIWFPIRFKESFYLLNEYLEETFVAKTIDINGQKALCNISIAEYSEITDVHLDQFEEWVEDTYEGAVRVMKKEHDISEEYMAMTFNLYATTLGDGFSFGNDVKFKLSAELPVFTSNKIVVNGDTYTRYSDADDLTNDKYAWKFEEDIIFTDTITTTELNESTTLYHLINEEYVEIAGVQLSYSFDYELTDETYSDSVNLVWDSSGTGANISPMTQQLIGVDPYAKNEANITNFSKSIVVFPKDDEFWKLFLLCYNLQYLQKLNNLKLIKQYKIGNSLFEIEYNQLALSINENIELGSPLSFTIAFGDKQ